MPRPRSVLALATLLLIASTLGHARPRLVAYLPSWHDFPGVVRTLDLERVTHLMIAFGNPRAGSPDTLDLPAGIGEDLEHQVLHADAHAPARYEAFVVKLRAALHAEGKLLTAALATSFADAITPRAAAQFDFINLMSYDATGPWRPQNPGQHSPYELAVSDLEFWQTRKGVPRDRLVVGVPFFYGWAWGRYTSNGEQVSALTYREIVALHPEAQNRDQLGRHADAVYYNGIPTIRRKARLGSSAGGVMLWQILGDTRDENSLLRALDEELRK